MIHLQPDGTAVISAASTWLPGCYEDARTARYAFRLTDEEKAHLQDIAVARGTGIITWVDIALQRSRRKPD